MQELNLCLKGLRKKRNMTQKLLATKLCVSRTSIAKYESGVSIPPINILIDYTKIFDVTSDYILGLSKEYDGCILRKSYYENISYTKALKKSIFADAKAFDILDKRENKYLPKIELHANFDMHSLDFFLKGANSEINYCLKIIKKLLKKEQITFSILDTSILHSTLIQIFNNSQEENCEFLKILEDLDSYKAITKIITKVNNDSQGKDVL